jgi:glycosyltransferase involved in cell wall biosynthesis
MRILQLCLSPDFGGLEIHVKDFTVWLKEHTDHIPFLAVQDGTRLYKSLMDIQIEIFTLNSKAGHLPFFSALKLANFIKYHAIDIVHVHWKFDMALAALCRVYLKNNFSLIHTRHMSLPAKKNDIYHRFLYRSLNRFIATTRRIETQALQNLPITAEKIRQIYLGIMPPPKISSGRRKELIQKYNLDNLFRVGLFGRICEFKGQHLLLEALAILKQKKIQLAAMIVGEVMELDYLKKLKQYLNARQLQDQVIFLDFVNNPTELMQCIDVMVLTTKRETFGLVLIEGMHVGVPLIGADSGGVPEIIEHESNGLLFESGKADSLAQALMRLYQDKELRNNMIRTGFNIAREKFYAPLQFENILNVFKECSE